MAGSTTELAGDLEAGRAAFERRDWGTAVDVLGAADRAGQLDGADLERLGTALWWVARPDDSTDALERAFSAYEDAGHKPEAAWVAMSLAYQAATGYNGAAAGVWQSNAERLLAELPEDPLHARAPGRSSSSSPRRERSTSRAYTSPSRSARSPGARTPGAPIAGGSWRQRWNPGAPGSPHRLRQPQAPAAAGTRLNDLPPSAALYE